MTRKIYKYVIDQIDDYMDVTMKAHAMILTFAIQCDKLCCWALVDPDESDEVRRFRIAGTGHPIATEDSLNHINTVFWDELGLVLHIFDVTGREED